MTRLSQNVLNRKERQGAAKATKFKQCIDDFSELCDPPAGGLCDLCGLFFYFKGSC